MWGWGGGGGAFSRHELSEGGRKGGDADRHGI